MSFLLYRKKDKQKAKNIIKDQAELLEKPSVDLFGHVFRDHVKETAKVKNECKEIYAVSVQNKINGTLVKSSHFQNKMGGFATFTRKFDYQRQSGGSQGYKKEDYLVRKYNKKATLFNKNIPELKTHSKKEICFKETVPLPISGRILPEIVPLHQLRDIYPLLRNYKNQQFSSSRKTAIFCKR